MIDDNEFKELVGNFANCNLPYTVYPKNQLINVTDRNGVIHSYYAGTGTAMFRKENGEKAQKKVIRNFKASYFGYYCMNPDKIKW